MTITARFVYHEMRQLSYAGLSNSGRQKAWAEDPARLIAALRAAHGWARLPRGSAAMIRTAARGVSRRNIRRNRALRSTTTQAERRERKLRELRETLRRKRAEEWIAEIHRRGGETEIVSDGSSEHLGLVDRREGMALLHCEGWRYYGRSHPFRRAALSYLCGWDEGERWAVRVPGSITHVSSALAHLEPAAVKRARRAGRQVLRQGDVYVVETARDRMTQSGLPSRHRWDAERRRLTHEGHHEMLIIDFPARAYAQKMLGMGRNGRSCGD